jgi:hypothetical protein
VSSSRITRRKQFSALLLIYECRVEIRRKQEKTERRNLLNTNTSSLVGFLLGRPQHPRDKVEDDIKNTWKLTGRIFGSGNSGQAMVYEAKKISSPCETVALKSFEKKFPKAGPSRCYREFVAMDLLKGLLYMNKSRFFVERAVSTRDEES